MKKVELRSLTGYPKYRRAGLVLTPRFQSFELDEKQSKVLLADQWVESHEPQTPEQGAGDDLPGDEPKKQRKSK